MLEYNDEDDMENLVQEETNTIAGFKNDDAVTCGGVLTEVRSLFTKSGQKMAFALLEDMTGMIELVFFPKCYERVKNVLQEDALVEIKGKISIRDGMKPSVNVEYIDLLEKPVEEDTQEEVVDKKERLCLIYDMNNPLVHNGVMKMLQEYPGDSEVYLKNIATGQKYKSKYAVDLRNSLIYELETLIDKDNIKIL